MDKFVTKIGVEIHCRILSRAKLFSHSRSSVLPIDYISDTTTISGNSATAAAAIATTSSSSQPLLSSGLSPSQSLAVASSLPPNSLVSLFDAAIPGSLPVINMFCVEQCVRTGIALAEPGDNDNIAKHSVFERKHYFYCDIPNGYQITQQRSPIVTRGILNFFVPPPRNDEAESNKKLSNVSKKKDQSIGEMKKVRIKRIQLEQDTGKSFHVSRGYKQLPCTLIDLNRAGVGLMEIVTEPDMNSGREASSFIKTLQALVRHIGTCDGNMEDGSLRADINISVHSKVYGDSPRIEVKNLNSTKSVERAIEYEVKRLSESLKQKQKLSNETRTFDVDTGETVLMRSKEGAVDYRFFPDPDLPHLILSDEWIDNIRKTMPELPEQTLQRLVKDMGISQHNAQILINEEGGVRYIEKVLADKELSKHADSASKWICNDLLGALRQFKVSLLESPITPEKAIEILKMLYVKEIISVKSALEVVTRILPPISDNRSPNAIVIGQKLDQIIDKKILQEGCEAMMKHPQSKEQLDLYLKGQEKLFNPLLGRCMTYFKNRASPKVLREVLLQVLQDIKSKSVKS